MLKTDIIIKLTRKFSFTKYPKTRRELIQFLHQFITLQVLFNYYESKLDNVKLNKIKIELNECFQIFILFIN